MDFKRFIIFFGMLFLSSWVGALVSPYWPFRTGNSILDAMLISVPTASVFYYLWEVKHIDKAIDKATPG